MDISPVDQKNAVKWLFLSLTAAIVFATGLYITDERLMNSQRERRLGETLHELRTAQSSFTTINVDERQGNSLGR